MEFIQRTTNDEDLMYLSAIKIMDPYYTLSPYMINKLSRVYQEKIARASEKQRNMIKAELGDYQQRKPLTSYSNQNASRTLRSDDQTNIEDDLFKLFLIIIYLKSLKYFFKVRKNLDLCVVLLVIFLVVYLLIDALFYWFKHTV